uniref:GATA transcription factor MED6 n=1 Tax=Caenorhabditis remanei TaxID=31234 RepID=Q2PZG6_CAERE|nr:GATA transcription factor MED6 [Caenorhabditis remanei]
MDPLSYPFPTYNVDYSSTPTYSGYYPNTDYWNWVNYYYQNGLSYDQPTSSGYSFMTSPSTYTMSTPSTSSESDSTATSSPMLSMTPPFYPMPTATSAITSDSHAAPLLTMTPPTTTTPHRSQGSPKKCFNCFATETCQWRNVRSENGILCNACFIYQRKYKKTRPVTAVEKYRYKKVHKQSNKAHRQSNSD